MGTFLFPFFLGTAIGILFAYTVVRLLKSKTVALKEMEIDSLKKEFDLKEKLQRETFENFASDMLKKGSANLEESSKKSMEQIVAPLKERIKEFEAKVQHVYEVEARERFNLKKEIERMSFASENLNKALRGDFKTQGVWGEIVLERVLEVSGLREGIEYTAQGKDLGLKSEAGTAAKPDVIIHLPEGRHLIIDSKVSLGPLERWLQSDNKESKDLAAKVFISAVKQHVSDLSEKHYQNLAGLQSPDFVFLFFPIDSAIVALHEMENSLFLSAWNKRVVIVGPSTLLPTLKTVESIWKNERQNLNALEIARLGGLLYDKLASFCDDLVGIGKSIKGAQASYDEAMNKFSNGKGNLLRQTERLKEMGIRSQKGLPKELLSEVKEISE